MILTVVNVQPLGIFSYFVVVVRRGTGGVGGSVLPLDRCSGPIYFGLDDERHLWHGRYALVSNRCPGGGGEVPTGSRQKADRPVGRWRPVSPSVGDTFIVPARDGSALRGSSIADYWFAGKVIASP